METKELYGKLTRYIYGHEDASDRNIRKEFSDAGIRIYDVVDSIDSLLLEVAKKHSSP
jgi:hypothetical protein